MGDLHVCMGSSMRVAPANSMPMMSKMMGGKIVMMNLQATPIDEMCDLIIHEKIDKIMEMTMTKLGYQIPDFRRFYRLKLSMLDNNRKMHITGIDTNGACYVLFKSLKFIGLGPSATTYPKRANQKQPFEELIRENTANAAKPFHVICEFHGHYNEPLLDITVPFDKLKEAGSIEFEMVYHVGNSVFEVVRMLKGAEREYVGDAKFVPMKTDRRESSVGRNSRN